MEPMSVDESNDSIDSNQHQASSGYLTTHSHISETRYSLYCSKTEEVCSDGAFNTIHVSTEHIQGHIATQKGEVIFNSPLDQSAKFADHIELLANLDSLLTSKYLLLFKLLKQMIDHPVWFAKASLKDIITRLHLQAESQSRRAFENIGHNVPHPLATKLGYAFSKMTENPNAVFEEILSTPDLMQCIDYTVAVNLNTFFDENGNIDDEFITLMDRYFIFFKQYVGEQLQWQF